MSQSVGVQALDEPSASAAPSLLPVPTGAFEIAASASSPAPVKLSLIIPTFNESGNLREMVQRLTELLEGPLGGDYELIVVDDDSPDRSWEVALGLAGEYPRLRVMRRVGERGLSTAVIRGWQAARGDVLAVIDADLQHPPEVTLALFREIEGGADMAIASRHIAGGGVSDWALYRRVVSRGAQLLGLLLLPGVLGRVSDPMSGYFMVKRGSIAGAKMSPLGYKILIEVIGRGSVRWIAEVGYVFCERAVGESKATWRVYADYLRHLVRLRLDSLPIARFARFCAVGLSGVVVDMAVFYLAGDPHRLGWPLVPAKLVAAEVAVLNNFLWNDLWTFRGTGGHAAGAQRPLLARLLGFHIACGLGVVFNLVLLMLEVDVLGVNRYLANAFAIALVAVWNFWASKQLVWRGGARSP
jgi:dolichol-phosphate mannosyltransferase